MLHDRILGLLVTQNNIAKQKNHIEYTSTVTDYDVDVGVWPGRGEN